ncbi:MAG TPA: M1 family metallopeptidase [Bacteroidales bacterium]|nr:M1 family metallopeptidase [Bacteroidales bacterium]HPS15579.1 M1 family metallopeptidase [Bacteroidales bacterium]
MKNTLLLLSIFLFPFAANSQNYFQQDVKYTIQVKLDDVKHELNAFENIEYTNNSPNTLTFLYFHLWPNGYKNDSTAMAKQLLKSGNTFFHYSDSTSKGYIDSLNFKIDNKNIKWEYDPQNIDICKLLLNEPLKPGQTISISTPFHVKIPSHRISRMGHDGQSYQITQWFPKPAVYDMTGWNEFPYLNQGEFYSEFGTFDVYITLPENYVVGATGDLIDNEKEILWLDSIAKATSEIKTYDRKDLAFPASSAKSKTLHYHQENVHDFAWFADKRYHVLKGEVELPYTKRKVTTWVMFTNRRANIWKGGIEYVNDAIYYYSKWIGEYPYNHATAVDGGLSAGGGMEYPNITVISSGEDSMALEMVIMHEVGHNWFYSILGSNERKFPWMDEGINSFYEYRYLQNKYPGSTLFVGKADKYIHLPEHTERVERSIIYEVAAHLNNDQPIGLSAEKYSSMNYSGIVYEKSAVAMAFLKDYLGEDKFDKAMKEYFSQWKFKHPQPDDLKNILEKSTSENLDWFFNDMINTNKKIDYKICSEKSSKDSITLKIKNKGEINYPLEIAGYSDNTKVANKWFAGFDGKKKISIPFSDADMICINRENNCPEYNRKNNFIRTKGILKKSKPLCLQLLPGIDDPLKTQLSITPIVGFNLYNGVMPGVAIYNNPIPLKKFSYFVAPLYGTFNNTINGYSRAGFTLLPKCDKVQMIWVGASFSHFSYAKEPLELSFSKLVPEILVKFKNKNPLSPVHSEIRLRSFNIYKDIAEWGFSGDGNVFYLKKNKYYFVNQFSYNLNNVRKINPFSFTFNAEQGEEFMKASIEGKYRISYKKPFKGLDIRAFFGSFIYHDESISEDFRYKMDGLQGYNDYLFSNYYIGRSERSGILSQQFSEADGAFKVYTPLGQTWDWLAAINLKTSIPGKIPLKLYSDIAILPDNSSGSIIKIPSFNLYYNAGVQLTIIKNIFEIYFPLVMSKDIKETNDLNKLNYWQTIRYTFSLEKIDPFKLIRDIR